MKIVIVDDEPFATASLEIQLLKIDPQLEIMGVFNQATEALNFLKVNACDLLFLDIDMPVLNGFQLLEQLTNKPEIVFVTAFESYAIQAIKHFALDYILKPVDDEELKEVIKRFEHKAHQPSPAILTELKLLVDKLSQPEQPLLLSMSEGYELVNHPDIIRLESEGNYTRVYKSDLSVKLVSKTLKEFDLILAPRGFLRVHHSHLINPQHIKQFIKADGGTILMVDHKQVPVSRQRKDELLEYFSKLAKI